ncbi:hypothetical protein BCR33DRAFT_714856, partial [Rhizoclosmatium globosum]
SAGQWNNPQSGSQKPSGGNVIADYQTCYAGSSCSSSGFTCCVGPKDAWENKSTCRPSNAITMVDSGTTTTIMGANGTTEETRTLAHAGILGSVLVDRIKSQCTSVDTFKA